MLIEAVKNATTNSRWNYKKILREHKDIDNETGKITRTSITLQFNKEPAYVKLYFDCLGVYIKNQGLSSGLNDMLVEVLKRTSYAEDGQIVHLDKYTKSEICRICQKSLERFKQAIKIWLDNKILIRIARGVYQINPYIFGKGEWRNVANLRATFDFGCGEVKVEKEYNNKNSMLHQNENIDTIIKLQNQTYA